MNIRLIWKNLTGNKVVSVTTVLFITAAALLVSLAAMLAANLSGAIDRLMEDAKTPHFMQMQTGSFDRSRLEAFAKEYGGVEDFQVLEFLNMDSAEIVLGENSLKESLQDNGFSVQSTRFDFLLDLDNQPIMPRDGEIYVPVCYLKDGTAKVGDAALAGGMTFMVAGFVRDSQMNSTLSSSKRFLVSEADYRLLKPSGSPEYLIEFRLRDPGDLGAFEAAYSAAGLPANGPTLTWPLFRMISAVSDGIMIAVIFLIGFLVILIALLCVRFTLLAKIEDDYREIGVMRAIGMRVSAVRGIYLAVYAAMAAAGCAAGFALSLLLQKPMERSIRLNLGESGSHVPGVILGLAGVFAVFLLVLIFINLNLRRLGNISAVEAIRFGAGRDAARSHGQARLSDSRFLSVNAFLGIRDVLARKRLYATMFLVIVLASFIMIVPQNLYHTISGEEFVTYLGIGNCDLRMDIQQTARIDEKTAQIGDYMENDGDIAAHAMFTTKIFPMKLEDGSVENIKIELGDHSVFPLQYAEGRQPVSDHEIALSVIQAEELGKLVGSQLAVVTGEGEIILTVCGIYSDITNGGKTAKAVFEDSSRESAWSVVCASLTGRGGLDRKISIYKEQFPYAKVSGIGQYTAQTFGQTLGAVRTASVTAALASAAVTFLVTVLFMRLLAVKDRYSIAVMRAVGFTVRDIRSQYAWRAGFVLCTGIVMGTVLAGSLGEKLSGAAIASFGAAAFHFTANPLAAYVASPLILFGAAFAAALWGTQKTGDVKINESIKE